MKNTAHTPIERQADVINNFAQMKSWQKRGRESGAALAGHVRTAHGGIVDKSCRACNELAKAAIHKAED